MNIQWIDFSGFENIESAIKSSSEEIIHFNRNHFPGLSVEGLVELERIISILDNVELDETKHILSINGCWRIYFARCFRYTDYGTSCIQNRIFGIEEYPEGCEGEEYISREILEPITTAEFIAKIVNYSLQNKFGD